MKQRYNNCLIIRIYIIIKRHLPPMRPSKYRKDKPPAFILKLYRILQDHQNSDIIQWTEQNNGFVITDLRKFTEEILPKYFKHRNYNSFVRQLNMYDFSKIRGSGQGREMDELHGYKNGMFRKGEEARFGQIRRKEVMMSRTRDIVSFGMENGQEIQENNESSKEKSLFDRLKDVKQKQQKLQQICFKLISQNQLLLNQNQELAHRVKKESRKKQKILEQVFRIIGVSIAEFWDEFCEDTQTIEEKTNNFKKIYQLLMTFIDKNDLNEIMKTLGYFITPKAKAKIFKVVDPEQEANFLSNYSQEQIEQFINETNFILESACKPHYQYQ